MLELLEKGERKRERRGPGEIKHKPISGTLRSNQRSSEVTEPTGETAILLV